MLEIQGLLKEKEKSEQHLQGKLRELKESFEQKKKHSETLQAELKTALLEKVRLSFLTPYKKMNVNFSDKYRSFYVNNFVLNSVCCSLVGNDKVRM